MKRTVWTAEQLSELARLYTTHSPEAVAAAIGRSLPSVYSKANHLGLKSGRPKGRIPKPPTLASRPCLPVSKPAKASAKGPGYLDGPLIFTAATKRTYGASPQPSLRTSTFLE